VLAKLSEDVFEKAERDVLGHRDLVALGGKALGLKSKLDRSTNGIVGLG